MPKVTQYVDKQLFVCDILNNFWHIPLFKQIIMKYKLFSLFFMLLLPISGHAQNATILFSTEQDCEISIYEPIDGGYNNQLPTTILKVTTNKPCIYSTDIVSFNFIYCQFSQGTKCEVILFPNDSLKIHINNKQICWAKKRIQHDYTGNTEEYHSSDNENHKRNTTKHNHVSGLYR